MGTRGADMGMSLACRVKVVAGSARGRRRSV